MAQQNLDLGTIGDNSTGHFVYEAMDIIEDNFTDLYNNKANTSDVLLLTGGELSGNLTMAGEIDMQDYDFFVEKIQFEDNNVTKMVMLSSGAVNGDFEIHELGDHTASLNYTIGTQIWSIGTDEIITTANVGTQTVDGDNITFDTYLTLGSADVQSVIEELKDELDAAVLSAGSGDMLKSVYDTGNTGTVDDSEGLDGNDSAYHLSRANHTGTQTASTISDFDPEVSNNADVTANTAKVSNASHTGDATGDTVLTLATVNSDVGSFTNPNITVNAKGLITAASNGSGVTLDLVPTNSSTNGVTSNGVYDALVDINSYAATNSINGDKILNASIGASKLAGGIPGSYLQNTSVSGDKLATYAVTQSKISENAVTIFALSDTGISSAGAVLTSDGTNFKWDGISTSFTPVLTAASGSYSYTLLYAKYVILGNVCNFNMYFTSIAQGTASGSTSITGMPFNADGLSIFPVVIDSTGPNFYSIIGRMNNGASTMSILVQTGLDGSNAAGGSFTFNGSGVLGISGSYIANPTVIP